MRIAATLVRVSSEQQVEGWSLDAQLRENLAWAKNNDCEIADDLIFREEGVSASDVTVVNRKIIREIVKAASQKRMQLLIVNMIDRAGRDVQGLLGFADQLAAHGVELKFVREGIDLSTDEGRMVYTNLGAFAEYLASKISANVRRSKRERVLGGLPNVSRAFFGYDAGENGIYTPNKDAALVRRIFTMYLAGNSQMQIARTLNNEGLRYIDRYGGERAFNKRRIYGILTQSFYCGLIRYSEYGKSIRKRRAISGLTGRPAPQYFAGKHEPIVSREEFDQVQAMMRAAYRMGRAGHKDKEYATYVLVPRNAYCVHCGRWLVGNLHTQHKNGKKTRKYRCSPRELNGIDCPANYAKAISDDIEAQAGEYVTRFAMTDEMIDVVMWLDAERKNVQPKRDLAEEIRERIRRLGVQHEAGGIDDAAYTARVSRLKNDLAAVEPVDEVRPMSAEMAKNFMANLASNWRNADLAGKRMLWRSMFRRVAVDLLTKRVMSVEPVPSLLPYFAANPAFAVDGVAVTLA